MPSDKPITIIGGGLAGLSLGIALRQRGVPAAVWEAGGYPRHRVCGEFISGRGVAVLERLGLLEPCRAAGAFTAHTARFFLGAGCSPVRRLALPALGLSRHALDALLAETFQRLGGDLRAGDRWTAPLAQTGVVCAAGRRVPAAERGPRWFGVKAHVASGQNVKLEADLEMHFSPNGYVGINRIGGGQVNVCGLLRRDGAGPRLESKADWLRGEPGSTLRARLEGLAFDPASFCSVAGLDLRPQRAGARAECCLGDALTMTPPVTGNGMSMAFESAEIAAGPLAAYSAGQGDWSAARRAIARGCDAAFGRRLAWARRLQWMLLSPASRGRVGARLLGSEWLWDFMYTRTR